MLTTLDRRLPAVSVVGAFVGECIQHVAGPARRLSSELPSGLSAAPALPFVFRHLRCLVPGVKADSTPPMHFIAAPIPADYGRCPALAAAEGNQFSDCLLRG
jgi:hypothetical protein